MAIPQIFGERMDESHLFKHSALIEWIRAEEAINVASAQIRHHFCRWHHAQLHIGIRIQARFSQVIAQEKVMNAVLKRNRKLKTFPVFWITVFFVTQAHGDRLPVDVLNGGHIHRRCVRPQPQADGQRHGAQEMRGIVFFVDHLVADQRPARRLGHLYIQALLVVEAQRVRHDEGRGAGDGDEANLEVFFLQRILILRHGLHRANRQHAGNGCHRGFLAHSA